MENVCKKCQHEMDMYYTYWCPRCSLPPEETKRVLNLIQTITYVNTHNGFDEEEHRSWWLRVTEHDLKSNDSYMRYYISDDPASKRVLFSDKFQEAFENHLLSQGFKRGEEILFWVSW